MHPRGGPRGGWQGQQAAQPTMEPFFTPAYANPIFTAPHMPNSLLVYPQFPMGQLGLPFNNPAFGIAPTGPSGPQAPAGGPQQRKQDPSSPHGYQGAAAPSVAMTAKPAGSRSSPTSVPIAQAKPHATNAGFVADQQQLPPQQHFQPHAQHSQYPQQHPQHLQHAQHPQQHPQHPTHPQHPQQHPQHGQQQTPQQHPQQQGHPQQQYQAVKPFHQPVLGIYVCVILYASTKTPSDYNQQRQPYNQGGQSYAGAQNGPQRGGAPVRGVQYPLAQPFPQNQNPQLQLQQLQLQQQQQQQQLQQQQQQLQQMQLQQPHIQPGYAIPQGQPAQLLQQVCIIVLQTDLCNNY